MPKGMLTQRGTGTDPNSSASSSLMYQLCLLLNTGFFIPGLISVLNTVMFYGASPALY